MIRRLIFPVLLATVLQILVFTGGSVSAAPEFRLGFATLASLIPNIAGVPLEDEHHDAVTGDSLQATSNGLMVWRKADNWTAFTDGHRTWINGPLGLQERLNTERFAWEVGATPPPAAPEVSATTVETWSRYFEDQRLKDALAMAYTHAPDWRPFADRAAERQARVEWGSLPAEVGGFTRTTISSSGGVRVLVVLNSRLQRQPTQVVAAVLAHETYHAATADSVRGTEGCYQNEIAAYTWESYVWRSLPRPPNNTPSTLHEDRLVRAVESGIIEAFVRDSESYQQQCS